uniref:Uncharacterized protein isoform X2 n=1 Tax=Nicotiana tabacum TaxID=4097 RepID=A0A1S3XEH3_TOBAC|nr:PREDICTED: uncharacterized protein LOC107764139 isoform X2 [Nicotiana tabacum]
MTLGDKPMAQFLREAKAIADELTAAGTPVSLDEFNATIFRLLPSYYHPVIAMLFEEKSQSSQENNGYRNNGASSKGNMKWFPNPCQICGLNNHQAK